jgi:protoheme IX farnesyltransferase
MAASALNEVQESGIDATMTRTRGRPLPSGAIPRNAALLLVGIMTVLGSIILYATHGATPALLGLLALVWYNGIYTPLKRITAFAVVPGSVIGALPPAIGWATAGGAVADPALLSLCFVFFMWQVPHFWILSLRHQQDYARAGLPTIGELFSPTQVHRLIFTWTCASVAASMLMLLFQAVSGIVASIALVVAGVWLVQKFTWMLQAAADHMRLRASFMDINRYALALMAAVIFDSLVGF